MKKVLILSASLMMAAGVVWGDGIDCPVQAIPAPANATFGPYLIEGFGTEQAIAYGLPNCAVAKYQAAHMIEAVDGRDDLSFVILAKIDGTFLVGLQKQ